MSLKKECDIIIILNQLQEMIEVDEDSEESSSNIKKLKILTEQMGLLWNFFLCTRCTTKYLHSCLYHQQQNKWYPKGVYLPISKTRSILAVRNLLAYNKLLLCYYVQVNSLRIISHVASKWASKHI